MKEIHFFTGNCSIKPKEAEIFSPLMSTKVEHWRLCVSQWSSHTLSHRKSVCSIDPQHFIKWNRLILKVLDSKCFVVALLYWEDICAPLKGRVMRRGVVKELISSEGCVHYVSVLTRIQTPVCVSVCRGVRLLVLED